MSLDRRLDQARQAVNNQRDSDPLAWVHSKLQRFAQGTLPWEEAVPLFGQDQLDQWRHRVVNLVKWQRFDRAHGEGPGLGEAIQLAIEIASYSPDENLPWDVASRIDTYRAEYMSDSHFINEQYLVLALLATTLLETPDGMPLRRWLDEREPEIWAADPDPRVPPGYDVEIRVGGQNRPQLVTGAILGLEEPNPDAGVPDHITQLWERWIAGK
jgi:hypothetical protein